MHEVSLHDKIVELKTLVVFFIMELKIEYLIIITYFKTFPVRSWWIKIWIYSMYCTLSCIYKNQLKRTQPNKKLFLANEEIINIFVVFFKLFFAKFKTTNPLNFLNVMCK